MDPQIIRSKRPKDLGRIKVVDILNTGMYPKVSVAKVERIEDGKLGYDTKSDIIYYVLKGTGKCTLDGKIYKVKEGDTIFVPKNTRYKSTKGLTFLSISSPRFNTKDNVYVK